MLCGWDNAHNGLVYFWPSIFYNRQKVSTKQAPAGPSGSVTHAFPKRAESTSPHLFRQTLDARWKESLFNGTAGQRTSYFSAAGENKLTGRDNILCMAVKWWEGWRSGRAWLSHSASTAACVMGASDVNCGSLAGHLVTSLVRQSSSDGAKPRSPERTSVPICSARPPLPPPPSPAASSSAGADCGNPLSSCEPHCLSPKNYSEDSAVVLFKLAVTLTWPLRSLPLRFQTPSSPSQNVLFTIISIDFDINVLVNPSLKTWLTGPRGISGMDSCLAAGNIRFESLCFSVPVSCFTVYHG